MANEQEKNLDAVEIFELKGNLRKQAVTFKIVKDFNYGVKINSFQGEEIPEPAKATFENFFYGVAKALANFTSINNSQDEINLLRKEYDYQLFSQYIVVGDAKITYKKGTQNPLEIEADAKKTLDFLLSITYGEEIEVEGEPEIIY